MKAKWRYILIVVMAGFLLMAFRGGFHEPRFEKETFDQIQKGMTRGQVESVLGCPSGNYSPRRLISKAAIDHEGEHVQEWVAEDSWVMVRFDSNGAVIEALY